MTSKEFYLQVDASLEPECSRLGFIRVKRTTSLWMRVLGRGTLIYEISKSIRHGFIPHIGGRFNVHCDLTPIPDVKARGLESSISYMEYYDEADFHGLAEIQDRVLRKIVSQKPADEFYRMLLESHTPLMSMDIGKPFRPHGVFTLPYLDLQDVEDWASFFAARLGKTVQGVEDAPRFFMRSEIGQGGPANGSQPIRSETKSASSGAGSGR
jgi:hypothetical protein